MRQLFVRAEAGKLAGAEQGLGGVRLAPLAPAAGRALFPPCDRIPSCTTYPRGARPSPLLPAPLHPCRPLG